MTDPISGAPEQSEPPAPTVPIARTDSGADAIAADATSSGSTDTAASESAGTQAIPSDVTVPVPTGAHDPWSRDAETIAVPATPPTIEAPGAPLDATGVLPAPVLHDGVAEPTGPRRRRTAVVLSIVAVVIVLLGAGAYAGVRYWTGAGTTEPESAVPASVTAFARIDLSPGLRDKLGVDGLVKKFPTNGKSTQDLVNSLESNVSKSAGLNYVTDVKPWFGGQAGAAAWTDSTGAPVPLLVFSTKSDSAAKTSLGKVQAHNGSGKFGFAITNGYALIAVADSGSQADATAAAKQASAHNLADAASFKSAIGHLSGHNLILAYADLGQLGKILSKEMSGSGVNPTDLLGGTGLPGTDSLGALSALTTTDSSALTKLKGTIIVGGSIVGNGVEIRAHAEGVTTASSGGANVRPALDAMPDTTMVGIAADGVDPNGATMKQLTPMFGTLLGGALGGPDDEAVDPSMVQALSTAVTNLLTSKVISIAFTGKSGDLPSGFLAFDTRDAAAAASLMSTINQFTGGNTIPGFTITNSGAHIQATIGGPVSSGKLSSLPLYTQTMSGMSNAGSIGYLDVQKIVSLAQANGADIPPNDLAEITPIKAVGFSSSTKGTSTDELIRIIITK